MISVSGLTKTFETKSETVAAIRDVTFEVQTGEIVTLLGPSGCGKTTTLRCVAGLERPGGGRIEIAGSPVVDAARNVFVPPNRRNLGMVFQSYAIWPHMNVIENVAYALEGRRLAKAAMRARAMQALETVRMAAFADRAAPRLSGGQQQRVAIARALVGEPRALLFDEPLSNLDASLRLEMRKELRRLQQQIGLTSIYVTHDQSEALAISDWIILMKDGAIVERGRPMEIYRRPRHVFTAQFLGTTNLFSGTIVGMDGERAIVDTLQGRLIGVASSVLPVGAPVKVSVRPEAIGIAGDAASPRTNNTNALQARVELAVFVGGSIEIEARCGDMRLMCVSHRLAGLEPDDNITLAFAPEETLVLVDA